MADSPWMISLLGGLAAERDGVSLQHFRTRQTAALLAYLAYFKQRAHPRETLIDMLWPEADLSSGRNRLNIVLSALRRQLTQDRDEVVRANHFSVQLNPDAVLTDVEIFEKALALASRASDANEQGQALTTAVAAYRGVLLPGFYEPWIAAEQGRLTDRFVEAVERLALWYEGKGEIAQSTACLQQALTIAPESDTLQEAIARLQEGQERRVPQVARNENLSPTAPAITAPPRWQEQLPAALTRFLGREEELRQIEELLADGARLITITGPGGMGKSRLSREVGVRAVPKMAGRVWFVALADVTDADALPVAIVEVLRRAGALEMPTARTVQDQLSDALNMAPTLLILDNLEQVADEGAEVIATLLERVPTLQCVVTSRRTLSLGGERIVRVPPMPVPSPQAGTEALLKSDAVALFMDRARAIRADLPLTPVNVQAAARLCRLLDGIPLAIEIAAARVSILSLAQMCADTMARREWLRSNRRDLHARHRSLWAAMEGSYELLSPELKERLASLAVFGGSWTLEAAATICKIPMSSLLDQLQALVEFSLLQTVTGNDGEIRFTMLETLREFAREQLAKRPEDADILKERHTNFYTELAGQAAKSLQGSDQRMWLDRLEVERENFQTIFEAEQGLPLAIALHRYWMIRGYLPEGRRWLEGFITADQSGDVALQSDARNAAGIMAWSAGDLATAMEWFRESLKLLRLQDRPQDIARALNNLGIAASQLGDLDGACAYFEESLSFYRQQDDSMHVAVVLSNLGGALLYRKDIDLARVVLEESLDIQRQSSEPYCLSSTLHNLAEAACGQGDTAAAAQWMVECLGIRVGIGDRSSLSITLLMAAMIAVRCSPPDEECDLAAVSLLAFLPEAANMALAPLPPPDEEARENLCQELRGRLDVERYKMAWDKGVSMPPEDALILAEKALLRLGRK